MPRCYLETRPLRQAPRDEVCPPLPRRGGSASVDPGEPLSTRFTRWTVDGEELYDVEHATGLDGGYASGALAEDGVAFAWHREVGHDGTRLALAP